MNSVHIVQGCDKEQLAINMHRAILCSMILRTCDSTHAVLLHRQLRSFVVLMVCASAASHLLPLDSIVVDSFTQNPVSFQVQVDWKWKQYKHDFGKEMRGIAVEEMR